MDAFRTYLVARETQRIMKAAYDGKFASLSDDFLTYLTDKCQSIAEQLSNDVLARHLKGNGIHDRIKDKVLNGSEFSFADKYPVAELVPTLYVSNVPHRVTHGTLLDMVEFAKSPGAPLEAKTFHSQVHRVKNIPRKLELPILVVKPSRDQRSDRGENGKRHYKENDDPSSGYCTLDITEGSAYIEDGNHRAVARLLANPSDHLSVIVFDDPRFRV